MNEVMRQEKKYLINLADGQQLCSRLGNVMIQDEHNGAMGYNIRSLYFDTLNDDDFNDKVDGLELRHKIRLRCYDPHAGYAMLEMKQKEGQYQKKRSLRMGREDAKRLVKGDYTPLLHYHEPFARECYGLMNWQCYRPKAVVEYRRHAYIAKEADFDIFSPELLQYPVLDPYNAVLEVKYNGFLLSYIKDLVNEADRSEFSTSKYCLARSIGLRYVP